MRKIFLKEQDQPCIHKNKSKSFFKNDFEIETMKNSLFYGDASGSFKTIFAVFRNKQGNS